MNKNVYFAKLISVTLLALAIMLLPEVASANCSGTVGAGIQFGGGWGVGTGNCTDPIGAMFTTATGFMTGTLGRALCAVAIIIMGIGALFGRITWIRAMVIALGIGIIFGASSILHAINGGMNAGLQMDVVTGQCDDPTTLFSGLGSALGGGLPLNHICDILRTVVDTIAGSTGQGVALLGVLIIGLTALFGRLSPGMALLTTVGIALVYGAVAFVKVFWVDANDCLFSQIASVGTPEFVLCRFLQELRGESARMLATIAVMILGFLALLGRLAWHVAILCLVGIATVYGSDSIIGILAPSSVTGCEQIGLSYTFGVTLGAIEGVLCNVVRLISGTGGKALASAAIVMLGFGAMMGKVNYVAALTMCCGIALAFGAPHFVFILTGVVDSCALSATVSGGVNLCGVVGIGR